MMNPPSPTLAQLTHALTSSGLPTPAPSFLSPILNSPNTSQRTPPLTSLVATARLRLLQSDITHPGILASTTATFPRNISAATVVSASLSADIPCQVLGVEDLSLSRWDVICALESERKGETTKGREVIRVLPTPPEDSTQATQSPPTTSSSPAPSPSLGPFKILLQDAAGQRVYAFELRRVEKLGCPPVMNIGCKVVLRRGAKVARGVVLLEPATVVVLGGKMEGEDRKWREGREERLRGGLPGRED
ncbi:hypothetical protein BJ875DRAFT_161626 [Amylocarpus encephaloides]|uniref:RecQ mediated genome instability protein 1 OB-fold domain-containing protein n=1 Tax=Amylocarpus encephaloides TaxID=45428 RepID=A0A9P8C1V2_9HELO|nr:hypothetical protein BJ875DRAFT_161626 [Amylocarpus encephaloides]